ncbi:MAG: hypothetical protein J5449_01135 [Oscillospiraceae bacterium]|nr:hypothetical protein [Oscillospiraceae bacterium]
MTDIIHEHKKEEQPTSAPKSAPEEEVLDEKTGQKRVYGYIILLFVVAFFLLLWSFLMNQRSNEQVISELRGSTGTLQSTLDRNVELEKRTSELEAKISELESQLNDMDRQKSELEKKNAELERRSDELSAEYERSNYLGTLCADVAALEYAYSQENYARCRELIGESLWSAYQSGELFSQLDTEADRPMTRAHFEEIMNAAEFEIP